MTVEETPPQPRGPGLLLWVVVALVGALLLVGVAVGGIVLLGGDDPPAAAVPDGAAVADQACRDAVLAKLKAPATAQIEVTSSEAPGPDYHDLAGTVDSENGFGALIRNEWVCRSQAGGPTVALVGKAGTVSIDESLAAEKCERAILVRLRHDPVVNEWRRVDALELGWKVTGRAEYDPEVDDGAGWQDWACEVIPDREKAFEGRMRVTGTGVGE